MSSYVSAWLGQLEGDPESFLHVLDISSKDVRKLMRSFQAIVRRTSRGAAYLGDEDAFTNALQVLGAFSMSKKSGAPCEATFDFKDFAEATTLRFSAINDSQHLHNIACQAFFYFFVGYIDYLRRFGRLGGDLPGFLENEDDPIDGIQPPEPPDWALSPEDEVYRRQVREGYAACVSALPELERTVFHFKREGCTLRWLVENGVVRNMDRAYRVLQNALALLNQCLTSKGIDGSDCYYIDTSDLIVATPDRI